MKKLFLICIFAIFGIGGVGTAVAVDVPSAADQNSLADELYAKFGRKPVVGVSVMQFNNVTIQAWIEQMEGAAEFHGIDLRVVDGQNDAARQANQNDTFIAQNVDCILFDPVDAMAVIPVVKRANEAIDCVINIDVEAGGGEFASYIGHDWLMAGLMSGLQIIQATGGKGNVVLVEGAPGTNAQIMRTKGIEIVTALWPDLKIVGKQPGYFNRDGGLKVTEAMLAAHPKIDAMYFQNDEMYFGGYPAIVAAGRRDEMAILSVDGNPDAMERIKTGDLDYEVVGQFGLQGWLFIETTAKVLAGKKVLDWVPVNLYMADKSNVATTPSAW